MSVLNIMTRNLGLMTHKKKFKELYPTSSLPIIHDRRRQAHLETFLNTKGLLKTWIGMRRGDEHYETSSRSNYGNNPLKWLDGSDNAISDRDRWNSKHPIEVLRNTIVLQLRGSPKKMFLSGTLGIVKVYKSTIMIKESMDLSVKYKLKQTRKSIIERKITRK